MQRISGPHRGYFIATYTVPEGSGFVGHGKACVELPDDVQAVPGNVTVASGLYMDEFQALLAAEHKLMLEIDQLPPSWAPFTDPGPLGPR